jgi:hypothetical protein
MSKIGRNQPCPCKSGKKYKHCHGSVDATFPTLSDIDLQIATGKFKARKHLREISEGFGKPIMATDFANKKVVFVGGKLYSSENWRFFTDFLIDFAKDIFGYEWGNRVVKSKARHLFIEWLQKVDDLTKSPGLRSRADYVFEITDPSAGALFSFCYSLYLICHHDVIPKRLLNRLRENVNFLPAVIETLAFSAFATAGYKMTMLETKSSSQPEAEFQATYPNSGVTYNIEVKRKSAWRSDTAHLNDPKFESELRSWIRDKIHVSSKKKLHNAIFWLELSIPVEIKDDKLLYLRNCVEKILSEAEFDLHVDGNIPNPAYIIITNSCAYSNNPISSAQAIFLAGFHIKMPKAGEEIDIEEAMNMRERDTDIRWLFQCFERVQRVPHSFDGIPDALLDEYKRPIDPISCGDKIEFEDRDGNTKVGVITQLISHGSSAMALVTDPNQNFQHLIRIPLTENESKAAEKLGDWVFGTEVRGRKTPENDPLALYDFFLESYASTSREMLLSFISNHPNFGEYEKLNTEDLRKRVCREWTKSALAN